MDTAGIESTAVADNSRPFVLVSAGTMDAAAIEPTSVANNSSDASPSPPSTHVASDTESLGNDRENTPAGVLQDSGQTDPVTSARSTFSNKNSSSEVIHDAGTDDENFVVDDMFGFVSIDLRNKAEQQPNDLFTKDSQSADDDDILRADRGFGEHAGNGPISDTHATHRAKVLDVIENDVTDYFVDDPFENVFGRTSPPAFPTLDGSDGLFTNNNTESLPMVWLSGQSTQTETRPLAAESEFEDNIPEKQTPHQAGHEEDDERSFSQSTVSAGKAGTGSGPGTGAGSGGEGGGETEGVTMEDEGQEKSLTPLQQLLSLWYMAFVFLTPIVLLPLPLVINTPVC